MSKLTARFRYVLEREMLSVWIIVLALGINVLAWVIPRGSYQHPTRDPLGLATSLSEIITDERSLHYFWHAVITVTVGLILCSVWKIWTLGLNQIVDRCDL